ncbi:hypothetical protein THRCLA_22444 [Thraustotheca clavata]|uniref:Transmembrane protein 198 n=1 Tax=Thraustotheca clavata TaxID=74557 RepID=A0A1V9Z139_9STRA|nr:hypothetical protein THRCLA_22444 [Thraustotheca clavata]
MEATTLSAALIIGSVALLLVSLFITFLGYKHFSTALVFQGAILGGFLGWEVGQAMSGYAKASSPFLNLGVACAIALIFALFTLLMKRLVQFLFGVALGIQLGSVLNIVYLHTIDSSKPNQFGYCAMAGFGFLFGAMACIRNRAMHVILTAWVGAYWIVQSIGNMAGGFPSLFYPFPQDAPTTVPTAYFIYIGGWLFAGVLGTVVQFQLTAVEFNHHTPIEDIDLEKDSLQERELTTPYTKH